MTKFFLIVTLLALMVGCNQPTIVGMYDVRIQSDVEFANRDTGPLVMDIGFPVNNTPLRPAILWLHGGAYAVGDKYYMRDMVHFTASLGYVSASSEYRLTPQGANMSDIYNDACDAFRYLHQHFSCSHFIRSLE